MFKLGQLRCSFCGKNEAEVSKLVAGPRVYICDECVAVAGRLMSGADDDRRPPGVEPTIWRRMRARARRFWRGGEARRAGSLGVSGQVE